MHCTNCGNEINEKAFACIKCGMNPYEENNFCNNCGASINNEKQIICIKCGVSLKKENTLLTEEIIEIQKVKSVNVNKININETRPENKNINEINIHLNKETIICGRKNKITAGLLALFLGGLGVHKFYHGSWAWGIIYILFCFSYIPVILSLIEGIIYLTSSDDKYNEKYNINPSSAFKW